MIIDPHSWHPGLAFAFMLAPFVVGLSGVVITVYMACRNLDEMQAAFSNSSHIKNQMSIWAGVDLSSRCMQVGAISGAMLWSRFFIRRGELDPDEVRNFPPRLKRRILLSAWLLVIGMAWLFLAVALFKLTEG
jgi:hypothetical protein